MRMALSRALTRSLPGFVIILSLLSLSMAVSCSPKERAAEPTATASDARAVRRVSVQEAKALVDAGRAVLVDTRPIEFYQMERAKGAIAAPIAAIAANPKLPELQAIPGDKQLILYCT